MPEEVAGGAGELEAHPLRDHAGIDFLGVVFDSSTGAVVGVLVIRARVIIAVVTDGPTPVDRPCAVVTEVVVELDGARRTGADC